MSTVSKSTVATVTVSKNLLSSRQCRDSTMSTFEAKNSAYCPRMTFFSKFQLTVCPTILYTEPLIGSPIGVESFYSQGPTWPPVKFLKINVWEIYSRFGSDYMAALH